MSDGKTLITRRNALQTAGTAAATVAAIPTAVNPVQAQNASHEPPGSPVTRDDAGFKLVSLSETGGTVQIRCFDIEQNLLWSNGFSTDSYFPQFRPYVSGSGDFIITAVEETVYKLDGDDGSTIWSQDLTRPAFTESGVNGLTVSPDQRLIFVNSGTQREDDYSIAALNMDGDLLDEFEDQNFNADDDNISSNNVNAVHNPQSQSVIFTGVNASGYSYDIEETTGEDETEGTVTSIDINEEWHTILPRNQAVAIHEDGEYGYFIEDWGFGDNDELEIRDLTTEASLLASIDIHMGEVSDPSDANALEINIVPENIYKHEIFVTGTGTGIHNIWAGIDLEEDGHDRWNNIAQHTLGSADDSFSFTTNDVEHGFTNINDEPVEIDLTEGQDDDDLQKLTEIQRFPAGPSEEWVNVNGGTDYGHIWVSGFVEEQPGDAWDDFADQSFIGKFVTAVTDRVIMIIITLTALAGAASYITKQATPGAGLMVAGMVALWAVGWLPAGVVLAGLPLAILIILKSLQAGVSRRRQEPE